MKHRTRILTEFPVSFNPWKHHLNWVKSHISSRVSHGEGEVLAYINAINSNQVDVYTGPLDVPQIIINIDAILKSLKIANKEQYTKWIGNLGFKELTLDDNSRWVLRIGVEQELFVHMHPARNSPNAIRIHGNSWKTALVVKLLHPYIQELDSTLINEIRKKHLNLPPVKDLASSQRISRVLTLLQT